MITFTGNIVMPGSSTLRCGIVDPSNGLLYVVESSTPSFRKFNMATLGQLMSSAVVAGSSCITMINSSSAVVGSSTSASVDLIEVASGYRTNVTSNALTTNTGNLSQQAAGDTSLGIAFITAGSTPLLMRVLVTGSAITISQISVPSQINGIFKCVILKSAGRWLIGGTFGQVFEIDSSGTIQDSCIIGLTPNSGVQPLSGSLDSPTIQFLAFDNNMLMGTTTDGASFLYDWTTKTQLSMSQSSQSTTSASLSNSSSGICMYSGNYTTGVNNTSSELDFTAAGGVFLGTGASANFFADSTGAFVCAAMDPNSNYVALLQQTTEKIRVLTVVPRGTTTRTYNITDPLGLGRRASILVFDDSGGVGTAKKVLDTVTITGSPVTYRLPTGMSAVKELIMVGSGVTAGWGYSDNYTT